MMRHTRKFLFIAMIAALSLALAIPTFAQGPKTGEAPGPGGTKTIAEPKHAAGPRPLMSDDVYTPISKGYDLIRDGKYEAAREQFNQAAKLDNMNPFALNNLAVLDEREGKLNDALAHLKDATINAADYKDKVAQTCFVGGGCMAVKPVRAVAETSTILPIIQENMKKLEAKMAATGTAPPP